MFLVGLTSVADWIASDQRYFTYTWPVEDPIAYAEKAKLRTQQAISEIGWSNCLSPNYSLTPDFFFDEGSDWRFCQKEALEVIDSLDRPALVIIEAEAGSGKTEAGWIIADGMLRKGLTNGIYVAMPTQATSNSMHIRLEKFVRKRYNLTNPDVQMVHAGAALKRFEELIKPVNIEDEGNENGEKGETESSWFAPKKRALLAGRGQKGSIGGTRLAYKTCASSVPGIVAVSILDDFPYGLGTMGTLSII